LLGYAIYSTTSDGLRNLVLSGKLTQKQLDDLAKKIGIVEHDFASLNTPFANENMLFGITVLDESSTGQTGKWWERIKKGHWPFDLTSRAATLFAFEKKEDFLARTEKFDAMTFEAAKKEAEAIVAEVKASTNPIVGTSTPDPSKFLLVHRDTLAHLRLVRAGTILLATGGMPTLADPFGSSLFYQQQSGKSRIWSVGRDGKNQDGIGNWEGKPDIVFELPQ
jgi:hypothetical protein